MWSILDSSVISKQASCWEANLDSCADDLGLERWHHRPSTQNLLLCNLFDLKLVNVIQVRRVLKQMLDEGNGIVRFSTISMIFWLDYTCWLKIMLAPRVPTDADDKAAVITTLSHLGLWHDFNLSPVPCTWTWDAFPVLWSQKSEHYCCITVQCYLSHYLTSLKKTCQLKSVLHLPHSDTCDVLAITGCLHIVLSHT